MNRRQFLVSLPGIKTVLGYFQDKSSNLSKVVNYVKGFKAEKIAINGKQYPYHETAVKDSYGANIYRLQVVLKEDGDYYFAIMNNKRNHFLFDFALDGKFDGNLDVYISKTIVNDGNVFEAMDDAVSAFETKSSKNKNLKLVSLEDKANEIYKEELKEISSLLKI